MAMLQWAQIQILNPATGDVVADNIDNTTRDTWDSQNNRGTNVTWTIPVDWQPGLYTIRVFGTALYRCTENGVRTMCPIDLQSRHNVNLKPLPQGATCASATSAANTPARVNTDSSLETRLTADESSTEGTTGYSVPMHIVVDPSLLNLAQQNAPDTQTTTGGGPTKQGEKEKEFSTSTPLKSSQEQPQQQNDQHGKSNVPGMVPSTSSANKGRVMTMVVFSMSFLAVGMGTL
ncbi:hypothetical protein BG004_007003 [Podila humilis]|nr:hypothetical protein BG004_007003 [Podila humilis]